MVNYKKNDLKFNFMYILVALLAFLSFILYAPAPTYTSLADNDTLIDFDTTNVLDDLLSADENILSKLPPNEQAEPKMQVIQVVEYCYSYRENMRDNFGLYVYVYNPTNININTRSKNNQIQMAVAYNSTPITSESLATDYDKFELEFLNRSGGEFANLYYKFKVIDKVGKDGKTIAQRVNSAERRYDVSGIELFEVGATNAVEYNVATTYTFTGYAAGYGFDENYNESTLDCKSKTLDTISLDVKHTYYRTDSLAHPFGSDYQYQIDSVYFSVPDYYFETFGTLQRIKAEWYEFKTKDIVVTSDEDFYNGVLSYVGKDMSINSSNYTLLGDRVKSGNLADGTPVYSHKWNWDYNFRNDYTEDFIYYLFGTKNWCDIEEYDPSANVEDIGGVVSSDLYDYILSYNKTFNSGKLNIKDNDISADLFEGDIDANRKMENEQGIVQFGGLGRSCYDFDAEADIINWQFWDSQEHTFWENAQRWGFWTTLFKQIPNDTGAEISPIKILSASDFKGDNKEISNNLYVNFNDVDSLKDQYLSATAKGEKIVLFRFALSDYFSEELAIGVWWKNPIKPLEQGYRMTEGKAYRAKESVFLDFDIIQLTFRKDNDFYVIPVVSSPIDIVDDITPPLQLDDFDLLKLILVILLLILLVIILWPILPVVFSAIWSAIKFVFKAVVWIISLPFKLIKSLFKKDD